MLAGVPSLSVTVLCMLRQEGTPSAQSPPPPTNTSIGVCADCTTYAHRFKEAAKECSSALDASPNHPTALKTRSKAYEQQALFKQALADMQVGAVARLCVGV